MRHGWLVTVYLIALVHTWHILCTYNLSSKLPVLQQILHERGMPNSRQGSLPVYYSVLFSAGERGVRLCFWAPRILVVSPSRTRSLVYLDIRYTRPTPSKTEYHSYACTTEVRVHSRVDARDTRVNTVQVLKRMYTYTQPLAEYENA
jgi:hypothetical protein